MYVYIFSENALQDIVDGFDYHEAKQSGLGERFYKEVHQAAKEISILPYGYECNYKTTRERKTKNFPYKLIYTFEEKVVTYTQFFIVKVIRNENNH